MAPESFDGCEHTQAVDIWAAGVLAYYLSSGYCYPFNSENELDEARSNEAQIKAEIKEAIMNNEPDLSAIDDQITPIAKDFITKCLKKNPDERLTADEAVNHQYIKSTGSDPGQSALINTNSEVRAMRKKNYFQRKVFQFIANIFSVSEDMTRIR